LKHFAAAMPRRPWQFGGSKKRPKAAIRGNQFDAGTFAADGMRYITQSRATASGNTNAKSRVNGALELPPSVGRLGGPSRGAGCTNPNYRLVLGLSTGFRFLIVFGKGNDHETTTGRISFLAGLLAGSALILDGDAAEQSVTTDIGVIDQAGRMRTSRLIRPTGSATFRRVRSSATRICTLRSR
jgi:hypothetical protein